MLVTDSTSGLTQELVKQFNIQVVPLTVMFTDKSYLDGVDLTNKEFFPMLEEAKKNGYLPKTSQPSTGDFVKIYEKILSEGYDIISIHLSESLSGTVNSARTAASMLKGNIEVIDSKFITMGLGLQVLEAALMIQAGKTINEIKDRLHAIQSRMEVLFTIDTLEYLAKGGRIGKVSALLGSVLNIKPIVRVENGIYVPAGRARSLKQAAIKMLELMEKYLDGATPYKVGISHGQAPELANYLRELVKEKFNVDIDIFTENTPVLATHTGPGCFGMAIMY